MLSYRYVESWHNVVPDEIVDGGLYMCCDGPGGCCVEACVLLAVRCAEVVLCLGLGLGLG